MKKKLKMSGAIPVALILALGFAFLGCGELSFNESLIGEGSGSSRAATGQKIINNDQGTHDGYDYELWKDYGNVSMTLQNGGNFDCEWNNIGNVLFRKGKKFNSTQTFSQIGDINIDYSAAFNPNGNAYLCVYGWSKDPLVEYYIIESWGTYRPTGTNKGQVSISSGTYDLYETTRNNQPSIEGTKTFKQFWAVRTSKRTSGIIDVTAIFRAWDSKGMKLGKMYEVALTVEGYQSSGNAKVTKHYLNLVGGNSGGNGGGSGGGGSGGGTTTNGVTKIEAENMTKGGQYTGNCNSPFNGVTLYANNDKVSFNQNFSNNSHTFKVRGASTNGNAAQVQLKIGGTSAAEKTITATHNQGGKTATVELICVNDNDTWDAKIDWIEISAGGSGGGSTGGGSGGGSSTATRVEAENMTKGGQYTGNCSSPFNGVTLYANNDKVSFNQYFANNSHDFKVRGASTNGNAAQVQLKINGTSFGTFSFSGTSATEKTITANHNQGGKTVSVELICVNDNNTWDAKIDWIEITAK